ncbi:MAG TPA: DUF192 domain-containing protein [Candidatus Paceibacterota bacterium]|nr:DUF192 domain-containing protein [Candidatus Paceibacterota bacterium]
MHTKDLINERKLRVEVADSFFSHQRGLMFRKKLSEDEGMLFKFKNPQKLRFWGLNTFIPLDIAFINDSNEIVKISRISPFSTKVVSSDIDCASAIEANLDFFSKNKISIGDKINVVSSDIDTFITFV